MLVKQFFRKFPCILLALGIIVVVGGVVHGAEKDEDTEKRPYAVKKKEAVVGSVVHGAEKGEDTEKKPYAMKEAELQSRVMSFADRFSAIMITAIQKYEALKPSKENHLKVMSIIAYSLSNAYIIAGESDPDVALLDMISMVTLGRIILEEAGPRRYGKQVKPVTEGFRRAEKKITGIAAMVLTPDELGQLMVTIKRWQRKNPEVTFFPFVRFGSFAADRRESKLTKEEEPEGLFDSVEAATQQAEEMRLLAERGMYLGTRIPQLTGLFAEIWLAELIDNPDIENLLADISQLSQTTARLAAVAERAEKGGGKLVKHSMRQIIILIVIWWIGYIIARVIVQAISKKSSASRV